MRTYVPRQRDGDLPYGGSGEEWPYNPDADAYVLPRRDGDFGVWGFADPEWVVDDETKGQFRLNVSSPTRSGPEGTFTCWAKADNWLAIMDRIGEAVQFAYEEGRRHERQLISQELSAPRRPRTG